MIATCVAGGARNFFREGEAAGALDSGALDPRSPPVSEGMFTTDVVDDVDALEQPAAAGRKRRRTAVPENPTGATKVGMEANREAPKKRGKHLHSLGGVVGVVGSAASVGRPPEGRAPHASSSNVGGVVGSAAGVGRPSEGLKSNTSGSNVARPCRHAVV